MATLADIDRALAKLKAEIAGVSPTVQRSSYGGSMGGGVMGEGPNVEYTFLRDKIALLEKARTTAERKQRAADPNVPEEDRKREMDALQDDRKKAEADIEGYRETRDKTNKVLGEVLGVVAEEEAAQKTISDELDADFMPPVTDKKPEAQAPSTTKPAAPAAPAAPKPAAPTPESVKGLNKDLEELKTKKQAEKLKQQELKTKQMEREGEEADKAADQREYNALTPAQKLERSVRAREQGQAERARGAVSERREQLAADEEYKGMQIASSGSFKNGDVTQYVDPKERAAAQEYFTKRAADLRSGTNTAGARPVFSEDRSLTVIDIDPRYGGGKGTGASPKFASGDKFGPDPNTMAYEMIGGKPVPIMTVGQAYATQSRGPGINVYEKTGTIEQQLDALSARNIRAGAGKQAVDEQIEFALTGKRSPRAEEDKKKREAAEAAAAAAAAAAEAAKKAPFRP